MKLKKNKTKNILLIILGIFAIGVCIFIFINKIWITPDVLIGRELIKQPSYPPIIDVSTITYDAKTTIPNTGITFTYPSHGYYGMGAKISTAQHFGTFFEGIEYYNLSSGEQSISVAVYDMGEAETLDDVVSIYLSNMDDAQRRVTYMQLINGISYFLNPPAHSDSHTYRAITVVNGQVLEVTFDGGFDVNSKNIPIVITQFLTNLDFTCSTDCSDNSAPIINMDKYRFGNTE